MFANFWNWLVSLFSSQPTPTPVPAPTPQPTPITPTPPVPPQPTPPVAPTLPTLAIGATGATVTLLQTKLISLGYLVPPSDGDFGPITQSAVKNFQATNGLTASGVVDPASWAVLNGKPKPAPAAPSGTRPSNAGNIKICSGSITLSGVDVSNDEETIQWNLVANSNRKFAFVKASEGITIQDSLFPTNWRVGRAFLTMSPYHFFHGKDDGATQANNFLTVVGKLNVADMAPMIDVEEDSLDAGVSMSTVIENLQSTLDTIEAATGRVPIIYTNCDTWNTMGNPTQFARYPLYVSNIDTSCPSVPPPWPNWVFWQSTFTEVVPGISMPCDADMFNGSAAQFDAFVRTGALPF